MAWTLFDITKEVTGYLGTTTIMETGPDSSARHIIHRFRDKASLSMGEFRRLAQTNRGIKQIHYSMPTKGDWFGDMVYST